MSKLKQLREQQNLTQEELSEKSGISVRTIQRIEAGTTPKGHTLKSLAISLEIPENNLLETTTLKIDDAKLQTNGNIIFPEENTIDYSKVKLINLSSVLFVILPPFNIVVPLLLSYFFKQKNELTKQLVSVQIIWTLFAPVVFFIGIFLKLGKTLLWF